MTAYFVQGDDPSLRDREVQRVVDELLGDEDRSFALDDHTIGDRPRSADDENDDEANPGAVEVPAFAAIANALSSPPFVTASRIVVVREIGNLVAEQGKWIAGWMENPLEGVHLVLVPGGGRTPSALDKAIKAHAETVGRASGATADVLQTELRDAHLKLAPPAAERVAAHLGGDAGRVPELVELWHSLYGDDAVLDLDDVEQYLGALGTAGNFELMNAIDRGDVGAALETAHRMMEATSAKQPKPAAPDAVDGDDRRRTINDCYGSTTRPSSRRSTRQTCSA